MSVDIWRIGVPLVQQGHTHSLIVLNLYQKKKELVEEARKEYINMSNVIEQNTSNFTLIKLYNNQKEQKDIFDKENKIMQKKTIMQEKQTI